MVIMSYLEHQVDFGAHVLGFRSTHQYYKTAKYQLHRTTGHGDIIHNIFHQTERASCNQFIRKLNVNTFRILK